MARKARKKSAAKAKKKARKKPAAVRTKKRKTVVRRKSKAAARKTEPKAQPKGVIATVVGGFEAVVDTLADAERLQQKLQPHVPSDPE